jgi:hypothetical protein
MPGHIPGKQNPESEKGILIFQKNGILRLKFFRMNLECIQKTDYTTPNKLTTGNRVVLRKMRVAPLFTKLPTFTERESTLQFSKKCRYNVI